MTLIHSHSRKNVLMGSRTTPTLGWDQSLYPQMQFLESEGNHYTMYIQPNVDGLAQKIAAQAKAAQKEWEQQQISKGFVGPNRLRPARTAVGDFLETTVPKRPLLLEAFTSASNLLLWNPGKRSVL